MSSERIADALERIATVMEDQRAEQVKWAEKHAATQDLAAQVAEVVPPPPDPMDEMMNMARRVFSKLAPEEDDS